MENNEYFGTGMSCLPHSLAGEGKPKAQSEMHPRLGLTFGIPGAREDTVVTQLLFHEAPLAQNPQQDLSVPHPGDNDLRWRQNKQQFPFGNTACKACSWSRHSKGTTAWSGMFAYLPVGGNVFPDREQWNGKLQIGYWEQFHSPNRKLSTLLVCFELLWIWEGAAKAEWDEDVSAHLQTLRSQGKPAVSGRYYPWLVEV